MTSLTMFFAFSVRALDVAVLPTGRGLSLPLGAVVLQSFSFQSCTPGALPS